MSEAAASGVIAAIARDSRSRLLAFLAARSGDLAGAEDAFAEAFVSALQRWPADGVPDKPEAWLLQVARHRVIDAARREQVRKNSPLLPETIADEAQTVAAASDPFPDERLKLLFVCAHPAIDAAARTPLMLQVVLGLDAARIAAAFLVAPAAMGQRLVRAKNKIREAAIPFRVPEPPEWSERLSFVLDAIYAAYTTGWESAGDTAATHHALAAEAISLGQTLVRLVPDDPEARGLLALMLHCEARRDARTSATGEFVPLDQQDPRRWSRPLIDEAENHLRLAAARHQLGRYQLEAAIQSLHANRALTGEIDWPAIAQLYEGLVRLSPGIGSRLGRAVALAEAGELAAGWAALEALPAEAIASYQPAWAARAHLLRRLGRTAEACEAYLRAADLAGDAGLRKYLLEQAAAMK